MLCQCFLVVLVRKSFLGEVCLQVLELQYFNFVRRIAFSTNESIWSDKNLLVELGVGYSPNHPTFEVNLVILVN